MSLARESRVWESGLRRFLGLRGAVAVVRTIGWVGCQMPARGEEVEA